MKRIILLLVTALSCLTLPAKTALVVVAHGSPSPEWNSCVLDLESRLQAVDMPGIDYKRVALMEFAQPNIASVMRDCEREGIDTVFVLPLFISPSGHSEDDIPNILGLKYSPSVHADLVQEGAEFVKTQMHIVVGPTLMDSGVIEKAMVERVKALSTAPEGEAVLFLAHGDAGRIGFWKHILRKCETAAKEAGFDYVDYQLIGMGQNFAQDVKPLLERAASTKERILVQGIYLVSSVGSMARMVGMDKNAAMEGIVYGEEGILPQSVDSVMAWIEQTVAEWVSGRA